MIFFLLAFLLDILLDCWYDQPKKELACLLIKNYQDKCDTKLNRTDLFAISQLVSNSLPDLKDISVEFLFYFLEKSLDFPLSDVVNECKPYSVLYYSAISENSTWLSKKLHSIESMQIILIESNVILYFTENELKRLIEFSSQIMSKERVLLMFSIVLHSKVKQFNSYKKANFLYFCRSLLISIEHKFNEKYVVIILIFLLIIFFPSFCSFSKSFSLDSSKFFVLIENIFIMIILEAIEDVFNSNTDLSFYFNEIRIQLRNLINFFVNNLLNYISDHAQLSDKNCRKKFFFDVYDSFACYLCKNMDFLNFDCLNCSLRERIWNTNLSC